MGTIILILIGIIAVIIIWKFIKPYTIKYDTTLFLCGGLGSGKTLTQVKICVNLLRRARFNWWKENVFKLKIHNFLHKNDKQIPKPKPQIYSNIPIRFKPHFWSSKDKREWTCKLRKEHIILTLEMAQNSIVLIDELPQLVNQFNWDIKVVQENINEFITYFRHYYNGYILCNAQAIDDIVVQIRRKGNQAIWCQNFKKHFFGLFYSIEMCDMYLNDQITTTSSTFIDENTRKHFGLFPPKDTYNSRCYSERLQNIYEKINKDTEKRWNGIKTNKILRITEYKSPLDDETTTEQKKAFNEKVLNLGDKKERNNNK